MRAVVGGAFRRIAEGRVGGGDFDEALCGGGFFRVQVWMVRFGEGVELPGGD